MVTHESAFVMKYHNIPNTQLLVIVGVQRGLPRSFKRTAKSFDPVYLLMRCRRLFEKA
jgi:hypothetical protein